MTSGIMNDVLSHLLAGEGVGVITAEDEELAVSEEFMNYDIRMMNSFHSQGYILVIPVLYRTFINHLNR